MGIWYTGSTDRNINHESMQTDKVSVNLLEGWYFNGTDDYVTFDDDPALDFPDGDWSIGGWIKPIDSNAYANILNRNGLAATNLFLMFANTAIDKWDLRNIDAVGNTYYESMGTVTWNTWQHLLFIRIGTLIKLYINGIEVDSFSLPAGLGAINPDTDMFLGTRTDLISTRFFTGTMSNWAKWDTALSVTNRLALAGGIDARVIDVANRTWCCPMRTEDYSTIDDTLVVTSEIIDGWYFDGDYDDIIFDDNGLLDWPDGDWSMGGWLYPMDNGDTHTALVYRSAGVPGLNSTFWYLVHSSMKLEANWNDINGMSLASLDRGTFAWDTWQHILFVRTGTSLKFYVNNVEGSSQDITGFDEVAPVADLHLGTQVNVPTSRHLLGYMSQWGKWDSALTSTERAALVAGTPCELVGVASLQWCCQMVRGNYTSVNNTLVITNSTGVPSMSTVTLTNAVDCAGLDVYQGIFDAATYGLDLRGNVFLGSNKVIAGSNTWEISGNLDVTEILDLTEETSTFKLTGTSKSILAQADTSTFNNLWVTGTYSLTEGNVQYTDAAIIDGTLTLGSGLLMTGYEFSQLDINGSVTGAGAIEIYNPQNTYGFLGNDGTLTCGDVYFDDPVLGAILDPGDYSGVTGQFYVRELAVPVGDSTLRFSAGTYTFNNLYLHTYNATDLYMDTFNSPTINIQGDYTELNDSTGIVIWGTGDFTWTGSADQDLGTVNCLGDVVINKTGGTVTLTNDLCCTSLDIQDGNFDANGYDVTITGDFTFAGDTMTMGSGVWECGGNVDWESGTTVIRGTAVLKLTGSSKTLIGKVGMYVYRVWITGSYTVPSTKRFNSQTGGLEVDGTLTLTGFYYMLNGNLDLNSGGSITGGSYLDLATGGIATLDGTWDTTTGYIDNPASSTTFVAGTIDVGTLSVQSLDSSGREIRYGTGTHVFTGDVVYRCTSTGDLTVDTTTNSPTMEFQGDMTVDEQSTGQVIFA